MVLLVKSLFCGFLMFSCVCGADDSKCAMMQIITAYPSSESLINYYGIYSHPATKNYINISSEGWIKNLSSYFSINEQCKNYTEQSLNQCGQVDVILKGLLSGLNDSSYQQVLLELCPFMLYQVVFQPCKNKSEVSDHDPIHSHDHNHTHDHDQNHTHDHNHNHEKQSAVKTWISGILSVFFISLVGFGIILVIPLLKNNVYKAVLQYLVALAVGTLTGDAFLHLLPHALSGGHSHDHEGGSSEHGHNHDALYRGLVSLLGILLFYNVERIFGVITMKRNQQKRQEEQQMDQAEVNYCGLKDAVIIGHCSMEIRAMADVVVQEFHKLSSLPCDDMVICAGSQATDSYKEPKPEEEAETKVTKHIENREEQAVYESGKARNEDIQEMRPSDASEEMHGHSHAVPGSSVAYMVIMGDGLHNFTDGLIIGVAYVGSFSGGLSTSLAVLCHELPHELGDFAMLLKTGITLKQALLCNMLSAGFQVLGVVVGIAISLASNFSIQWLFSFASGIFLYIALVDMLPEISRVDKKAPWAQILLQNTGLLSGIGIMALIAAFEKDMQNIFT